MTPEEAGEIVLSGRAYEICGECMGEGKVTTTASPVYGKRHLGSAITIHSRTRDAAGMRKTCMDCGGSGVVLRQVFINACEQFGTELPKRRPFRPAVSEDETVLGFDDDAQEWVVSSDA